MKYPRKKSVASYFFGNKYIFSATIFKSEGKYGFSK